MFYHREWIVRGKAFVHLHLLCLSLSVKHFFCKKQMKNRNGGPQILRLSSTHGELFDNDWAFIGFIAVNKLGVTF